MVRFARRRCHFAFRRGHGKCGRCSHCLRGGKVSANQIGHVWLLLLLLWCVYMDSLKFHSTPRNPAASRRCFVADCSAAWHGVPPSDGHSRECNSPGWLRPLSLGHGSAGAEAPGRRPQEPLPSRWCCRRASRLCARLVASAPRRCRETTWAGSPWHRGRHETWPGQNSHSLC